MGNKRKLRGGGVLPLYSDKMDGIKRQIGHATIKTDSNGDTYVEQTVTDPEFIKWLEDLRESQK